MMDKAKKGLKDDSLYPLIFENSVEGILISDRNGEIIKANNSCHNIFGYLSDELNGQQVECLIPDRLTSKHVDHRKEFIKNPQARKMASGLELTGIKKNGDEVPLEIGLSYIRSAGDLFVICFITDLTDRQKLANLLRRERNLIRQYLDVTDSIFLLLDAEENIQLTNKAASEVLGLPEKELKGKNWFDEFIPKPERESVRAIFKQMMGGEVNITSFHENYILNSKGEKRLIEWHNTLIKDRNGQPEATLSSGTDITEKREIEKARTEALIAGQENERRRVAQELHDGLGQSISAISLNLNALEPELDNFNTRFQKIYSELKEKLNNTLEEVREISRNLTPRILEDFGLVHALEYLLETLDESTEVEISLDVHGEFKNLEKMVALTIYRIVQELVNNSLRHARPSSINVHVTLNEDNILALVEDDGVGFNTEARSEGMGISNIRARAELLNGEVHLDSNKKSGTSISVTLPL